MYPRLDHEARIALAQAADEARTLGHSQVGLDHLLLGLLANVRGETYALLTQHGLRFDSVRETVVAHHATDRPTDERAGTDRDDTVPLTTDYDEDRAALRAIGIDLDQVRAAVRAAFGEDISEGWGRRRREGRRGRGPRGGGPRGRHGGPHGGPHRHGGPRGERRGDADGTGDPDGTAGPDGPERSAFGPPWADGEGRGRRGPRGRGQGRRGRFSPALHGLLHEVRHETLDEGRDQPRDQRGAMSATRLLLGMLRSDDGAVTAALAGADDLAGLRAELEAALPA